MVRRHVKMFAQRLSEVFMSGPSYEAVNFMGSSPRVNVELHPNLMSTTITSGSIRIGVREWTHLAAPSVFKCVSDRHQSPEASPPTATVFSSEIRLEHVNLRMVDPRYPGDLVLGRRIVDRAPIEEEWHAESQARCVFCPSVDKTEVVYRRGFQDVGSAPLPTTSEDDELLDTLLQGKFKTLIEAFRKVNPG